MIKVVGLGPGAIGSLTIETLEILKNGKKIYLRTEKHPTVDYLKSLSIQFETYDDRYEEHNNFDEVYRDIAEDLIQKHEMYGDIIYGVPGHPLVAETSVKLLIQLCEKNKIDIEILAAVSFIDAVIQSLKLDPIEGLKIIDAFDIKNQVLDKRVGLLITQVYNKFIASEVKLALLEYYKDDMEIYFVRAAGIKGLECTRKIKLYELDRQEDIDYLTSIYIPKELEATLDFQDLIDVMNTLRGENGCAWDKEQTHESMKKFLIEECYEVLEAIDEKDEDKIIEELGDVLLQVVFHAQIGKEQGYFNINDIIKGVTSKMINRHPHIFKNIENKNSQQVLETWENIKIEEKGFNNYTDTLKHVPKNLPGLMRACKVQEKASKIGFDFDSVEPAMEKVLEELQEVKDVYKGKNRAKILEEVGDLVFTTVNVARLLDIDPEFAVNYTIDKFINRFEYIEENASHRNLDLKNMSLAEMDVLWNESKS
ncbi:nucleoside triphosphate pyrophosphohydrolase [Clostridium tagluense]|uniref:nucleoside triphosphate pyrophosphohydrolase n=1 Tax=Clostridium tagluense TaxID=360422 RepID=UPI001CF5D8CD|nr:nucleoside triphosphate pyrophosphohydrolase [Clostridium tagluense]MCB2313884.1 nucleoside triphosphate pyrophosphohydrolase [Clostridium tagluense]MCB2318696.1 nucleoside triphosphate pyrophosphohydrolase [Clostridium tagluense]MCB2323576.1 nucleoside triphosphate pyrophosphohydrolase [Clostridium tagluense]MCB2328440.1 nucleoside triphosphate pyrophosphohydrolase [Clostridium tagluense]MCB2333298.1 nucleoside triphosphate pyrophosphohydrolase [Clostridium tagluense]